MALVNIPQQGDITAEDPTSRVSGGDVARSASFVAQGAEQLGAGLEDVAVPLAEQAGREDAQNASVTRDPSGQIQILTPQTSVILGKAGDEYEHAVLAGTVARGQLNTSTDLADMRAQHDGDPAAFKAAYASYRAASQAAYGPSAIGQTLLANADSLFDQNYHSLVDQKARVDVSNAKDDLLAQRQATITDLSQMASSGVTSGPVFEQKKAQLASLHDALEVNSLYQMPKAVVDNLRTEATNAISGDAIIGHVDAVAQSRGMIMAQKDAYDSIDKISGFSDADRAVAKRMVDARISFLTNQNSVAIQANSQKMQQARDVIAAGGTLPGPVWDDMRQSAKNTGDPAAVQQFNALEQVNRFHRAMPGLTPNQQAAQMGVGGAPSLEQVHGAIIGQESGGNPNAATSSTGAKGIGQIEPATFAQYANPGENINNPADNLAVSKRIIHDYYTRYNGDAARVAVAYFSGPANVAPVGSPTPYIRNSADPTGKTTSSYVADVTGRLAGGAPASVNGVPFTPQELAANPFLGSEALRQVASDQKMRSNLYANLLTQADAQIKNGNTPSPQVFAQIDQLGRTSTDPTIQQHYQEHLQTVAAAHVAQIASSMPQAEGQAFLDDYSRAQQGADLTHMQIASTANEIFKKSQDEFKNNPFQYAAKRGIAAPVPPLDFTQAPDAVAAALSARSAAASALSVQTGVPQSVVAPNETDAVKTGLAMGPPQASAAFLQSVGQLPPDQMQATLNTPEVKTAFSAWQSPAIR
ncbi:MAG: lytic transglycosylase domain-containing protein [Methylocella sp.]